MAPDSLQWVDLCCIECRCPRRSTRWAAELEVNTCRHVGTALERPFWRAAGEPRTVDLVEDREWKEWHKRPLPALELPVLDQLAGAAV